MISLDKLPAIGLRAPWFEAEEDWRRFLLMDAPGFGDPRETIVLDAAGLMALFFYFGGTLTPSPDPLLFGLPDRSANNAAPSLSLRN